MNRLFLGLGIMFGIGATTALNAYDVPFTNSDCKRLFETGQDKLKIQAQLTDMANSEVGVDAKNLYSYANEAKEDFKVIKVAFEACQEDKPFFLNESTLDTFDRVEIEKNKLAFYEAMAIREGK